MSRPTVPPPPLLPALPCLAPGVAAVESLRPGLPGARLPPSPLLLPLHPAINAPSAVHIHRRTPHAPHLRPQHYAVTVSRLPQALRSSPLLITSTAAVLGGGSQPRPCHPHTHRAGAASQPPNARRTTRRHVQHQQPAATLVPHPLAAAVAGWHPHSRPRPPSPVPALMAAAPGWCPGG